MFFHAFLIKYGEIGIKGKNRYLFEDALVAQIRHALKHVEGTFKEPRIRDVSMSTPRASTITTTRWQPCAGYSVSWASARW